MKIIFVNIFKSIFRISLGLFFVLGVIAVIGISALSAMGGSLTPVTNFFFSNTVAQSYPAYEDWTQGKLVQAVETINHTVVLTGPTDLLDQPVGGGTASSQYDFNEPLTTPVAASLVVKAQTTPIYDSTLLNVSQSSIQFLDGAPAFQPNLLTNAVDPIVPGSGFSNWIVSGSGTDDASILGTLSGISGSSLSVFSTDQDSSFKDINTNGNLDTNRFPAFFPNGLVTPGQGTDIGFMYSADGAQQTYCQADYFYALDQPVTTDRLTFDINVAADANSGNLPVFLAGSVSLIGTDGSGIYPPALTFYTEGANGNVSSGLSNPQYFANTMLGETVTIKGMYIDVTGFQQTTSNTGQFNGPVVDINQVAAYAPVTNTNPVTLAGSTFGSTQSSNPGADPNMFFSSGPPYGYGSPTGSADSVFDFKQTGSLSYLASRTEGFWDSDKSDCTSSGNHCYDPTLQPGSPYSCAVTETFPNGTPGIVHSIDFEHIGVAASDGAGLPDDWDQGNQFVFSGGYELTIDGNQPLQLAYPSFYTWPGNCVLTLNLTMPDGTVITCDLTQFSRIPQVDPSIQGWIDFRNLSLDALLATLPTSTVQSLIQKGFYLNPGNANNCTLAISQISLTISKFPTGSEVLFGNIHLYGVPTGILAGANNVPATFISPVFDLGSGATSDSRPYFFSYQENALSPATSLSVYVRSGNNTLASTPNSQSGYQAWPLSTAINPVPGLGQQTGGATNGNEFFQYEVVMSHSDPNQTPIFSGATLKAGQFISPGTWTSQWLGLSQFFLPSPSSPLPVTMVSWRGDTPPGTSIAVTAVTSGDTFNRSAPVNVPNGIPFTLPAPPATTPASNVVYVQFTATLKTSNPNFTPELTNLDFGFKDTNFPLISGVPNVVTGTGIFFIPLDNGTSATQPTGIYQSNQSVWLWSLGVPGSFTQYLIPYTPFQDGIPGNLYGVTGFSQDYAGNVENPGTTQEAIITDFTFSNPTDEEVTNKPVTPTLIVEPGLTFNVNLYQMQNGIVVAGPFPQTSVPPASLSSSSPNIWTCPTISANGTYELVGQTTTGYPYNTTVRFTINNTPPQQPTDLTATAGAPSCPSGGYTLSWDGQPDPPVVGYEIVRDGVVLVPATSPWPDNPSGNSYQDCVTPGIHTYQVYAIDNAGNISIPAQVTTSPSDVLITDRGSPNRVVEFDSTSANLWQVPVLGSSTSPFSNILSACRVASTDGIDFGYTMVVDSIGSWLVDTTSYPGYPPLIPTDPNPVASFLSNSTLGLIINQIQKTHDGFFLMCATSTGSPGGIVSKFYLDTTTNPPSPVPIWIINSGLLNPTSVRELANGDVLITDQAQNLVVESQVPTSGPIGQVVYLAKSYVWVNTSFNSPNAAVQGQKTHNFYVANTGANQIVVLSSTNPTAAPVATISSGLSGPLAVDESQEGNAVVADTGHSRVSIFPNTGSAAAPVFGTSPSLNIGGVLPFDVRSVIPPYQIQYSVPSGNNNVFIDNPFTFNVTLSDIHGNPVPNVAVSFLTKGTYGSFVPPGTPIQPTVYSNSGIAEGTVNYAGGVDQEQVITGPNGVATCTYFPTVYGGNPVTVWSYNSQTLILNLYAQGVESIPVPPPPPPLTSFLDVVTQIVLSAMSTVATTALNSVGIPIVIDLSTTGSSIGVGADFVDVSINTNGTISGGVQVDDASLQANYNLNNGSFGGSEGIGPYNQSVEVMPNGQTSETESLGPFSVTEDSQGTQTSFNPAAIGSEIGSTVYNAVNSQSTGSGPGSSNLNNGTNPSGDAPFYGFPPCSNPVNLSNGQLLYTSRDLLIAGQSPQLGMEVRRTFNNLIPYSGSFGPQWSFEYDTYLYATPMSWTIYFGDGHQEVFIRNADGIHSTPINTNSTSALILNSTSQQWTYTRKDGTQYLFNTYGRVMTETDRWGNAVTCSYNSNLLLSTVQDNSGRTLTFTYSGIGPLARITQMVDPLGRVFGYVYDTVGDLTTIQLPDGRQVTYTYNSNHLLTSRIDPHQDYGKKAFSYQWDGQNRVVQETNALGYSTNFTYTITGLHDGTVQVNSATNANNYTTTDTFDSNGNFIQEVDPLGGIKTYTYDTFGNRLTATNALNQTMTFAYDSNNNLIQQTDVLGNSTSMTYEPVFSQMTSLTNALGKTWTFTYDSKGDLTGTLDPLGNTWGFTYNPQGRILSATNPRTFTTNYTLNNYGNTTAVQDPLGNVENYQYDIVGRKTSETDPMGNQTQYTYDGEDDIVKIVYADGSFKSFNFNSRRDLSSLIDENGHTTLYTYDGQDRKTAETDPNGGTCNYSYDPVGNMATSTDKLGHVWTYSYNGNNWMTGITNTDGGTQAFVYDLNGNKTSWTDADGNVTQFTYDPDNHLATMTDADGKTVTYNHDALERVNQVIDKNGNTTKFFFDDDGRTKCVLDADLGKTTYSFDAAGNPTTITDQLGHNTTLTYDANNRVTQVMRPEGDSRNYTYNPNGLWKTAQVIGCSCGTQTYTYNSRNLVNSITDEVGGIIQYGYDFIGNKNKITDANGHVTTYLFDGDNRVIQETDPMGDVTNWTLDANGRIIKKTDALGGIRSYTYDQTGRILQETNPDGGQDTYTYNFVGKITSHTDPNGHKTTFTYDPIYDLLSKIDALGGVTSYTYDPMGRQTSVTDANSHTSSLNWDPLSRLLTTVNAAGGTTSRIWDAAGNEKSYTDEDGDTTQFTFDKDNRKITQTDALGNTSSWTYDGEDRILTFTDANTHTETRIYDPLGRLTQITDANGGVETYGYDAKKNITSLTDKDHHTTTFLYDPDDLLVLATDAMGNKTHYHHDALHRLAKTIDPLGNIEQNQYDPDSRVLEKIGAMGGVIQYTYDPVGNKTQTIDPNGNSTSYQYDADNRKTEMTNALGGTTKYSYDPVGNQIGLVNADGNSTLYNYDPINRLVRTTDALGGTTTNQYDAAGYMTAQTDPNGNTTSYLRDSDHRVTTQTDARGGTTGYAYDDVGNVLTKTDADTNPTQYVYDNINRPVTVIDANTHKVATVYDPVGNPVTIFDQNLNPRSFFYDANNHTLIETDATGHVISYGYDADGNRIEKIDGNGIHNYKYNPNRWLTEVDLADGKVEKFSYDNNGNRTQAFDWNGTYHYNFDALNRVTQETQPSGKSIKHTFDPMGNEIGRVDYFGNKYSYTFDALNRNIQVTDPINGVTGLVYDRMQHVLQTHYPNKTSVNNTYDPTYDVLSTVNKKDTGEVISQFVYTYDGVGNKKTVVDNIGKTTYGYDNIYQLTGAVYPDRPTVSYGYDPAGNRLSMTVGSNTTNYSYDTANKLLTAGTVSYQYDGNGNPIKKTDSSTSQTTLYTYDTENRLATVTLPNGNESIYGYDYTGWKISDTQRGPNGNPDTHQYLWNFGSVVNEDGNEGQTANNVAGLINLSQIFTPKTDYIPRESYFDFDGLASITNVTDAGGNITDSYRYDAFGATLSGGKTKDNHYQFIGKIGIENEASVGLIYIRNRWYDPFLGRFITQDPFDVRGGLNLYEYSLNNPLNRIDPLGLDNTGLVQGGIQIFHGVVSTIVNGVQAVAEEGANPIADFNTVQGVYNIGQGVAQVISNTNNSSYVPAPDPVGDFINSNTLPGTAQTVGAGQDLYSVYEGYESGDVSKIAEGASGLANTGIDVYENNQTNTTDGGNNSTPITDQQTSTTSTTDSNILPWQQSLNDINSQTPVVPVPQDWQTSLADINSQTPDPCL